jgi:protein O-GlcNAc transferase
MRWRHHPAGFSVLLLLTAYLAAPHRSVAQEPSPALKQADADYRAGVAALTHNDLPSALADFQNVVKLAPSIEQGHAALGAVLVRMDRTSEAISEFDRALTLKPTDSDTQLNLALAYQQSGQPAKSLPWFGKVEASARTTKRQLTPAVLSSYAHALALSGQLPAAIAHMKQAVARDPHNADFQDELGTMVAQARDWSAAQVAFAAAVQARPDFAMAHLHLGLSLQALQQKGALEELTKAHDLAPSNALMALELGKALAVAGHDQQAEPVLQQALTLDPKSASAAYQLGLVLERLDRLQQALPLLQRAAEANPGDADALTNLGMALCLAQKARDAVPYLQRAVIIDPGNVTAHQNLAVAYIQISQFDDAIVQLRAALKLSPDASQLHYNLGYALKMQDDAAGAIPELEAAEKLDPDAPEAPYLLGVLYMQAARYADADRELNASLKLRPANADGWATLGSVDNKLDKLPEAVTALQEAIRQSPAQADPHLTLATVLARQNQPAEATEERKKAAELMRAHMNAQRAEVSTHSANALLESGKVDDAVADYREALSFDPNYAEAHQGLAKALDRQGKSVEAAMERQKAAASKPDAPH